MPHRIAGACSICGNVLPARFWAVAISRPDGKTVMVRVCERAHVLIGLLWVADWIRSGRIDRK